MVESVSPLATVWVRVVGLLVVVVVDFDVLGLLEEEDFDALAVSASGGGAEVPERGMSHTPWPARGRCRRRRIWW